jgi:hypothetical protein
VATAALGETPDIDARSFLSHIKFLASDDLQGRGNGSQGLERAAEYVAHRFGEDRLEPPGDAGTYYQSLDIPTGVGTDGANSLILSDTDRTSAFKIGVDYFPLSMTRNAGRRPDAAPLPVVFAGYGISAPALGYDDYATVDAGGKAAVILTDEPQEDDAQSVFEGKANTLHATMTQKAMVARSHNVKLLIVVSDPHHPEQLSSFSRWLKDPQAEEYGIQIVRLSREGLRAALGSTIDLDLTVRMIDGDLKPRSRELGREFGPSPRLFDRRHAQTRINRSGRGLLGNPIVGGVHAGAGGDPVDQRILRNADEPRGDHGDGKLMPRGDTVDLVLHRTGIGIDVDVHRVLRNRRGGIRQVKRI